MKFFVMCIFLLQVAVAEAAWGGTSFKKRNGVIEESPGSNPGWRLQSEAYAFLRRIGGDANVSFDGNGLSVFRGKLKLRERRPEESDDAGALKDLLKSDQVFHGFRADEYVVSRVFESSKSYHKLFRMNRKILGCPVYGGEFVAVIDGRDLTEFYGSPINAPVANFHTKNIGQIDAAIKNEYGPSAKIKSVQKSFFNAYLLNKEDPDLTVPSWTVQVVKDGFDSHVEVVIDDVAGTILFVDNQKWDALNRVVFNAQDSYWTTHNIDQLVPEGIHPQYAARIEGQSLTGAAAVDNTFDYMRNWYVHFSRYRDGADGNGGELRAFVNMSTLGGRSCAVTEFTKPNAEAYVASSGVTVVRFCAGMATDDIVSHELTHGLVISTANFQQASPMGGVHEGYADVFAYLITRDWVNGENSIVGSSRRADKPSLDGHSIDNWSQYTSGLDIHYLAGLLSHPAMLMTLGGNGINGDIVIGRGYNTTSDIYYSTLLRLVRNSTPPDWAKILVSEAKAGYSYGPRSTACDALMAVRSVGLESGIDTEVCTDKKKNVMFLTMLRR